MRCCFTRVHVHSSSNYFHCHLWVYKVVSLHCLEMEKMMCILLKVAIFFKYSASLKDPTSTDFYLLLKFCFLQTIHQYFWVAGRLLYSVVFCSMPPYVWHWHLCKTSFYILFCYCLSTFCFVTVHLHLVLLLSIVFHIFMFVCFAF